MKSALANVGEADLSRDADTLEAAGRHADFDAILAKTPGFINDLRHVAEKYAPEEEGVDLETDSDPAYLRQQFLAVCDASKAYNKRNAKAILDALNAQPCTKDTKAVINEISVFLLQGDFEEAAAAAKQAADNFTA